MFAPEMMIEIGVQMSFRYWESCSTGAGRGSWDTYRRNPMRQGIVPKLRMMLFGVILISLRFRARIRMPHDHTNRWKDTT
jgi:hypothetical protein